MLYFWTCLFFSLRTRQVGASIFNGGLSTFLAVMVMVCWCVIYESLAMVFFVTLQAVSSSFVFKSFFYMVASLVVCGLLAGIVVCGWHGCRVSWGLLLFLLLTLNNCHFLICPAGPCSVLSSRPHSYPSPQDHWRSWIWRSLKQGGKGSPRDPQRRGNEGDQTSAWNPRFNWVCTGLKSFSTIYLMILF